MDQENKEKLQSAAGKVAAGAFSKAKVLSGWKKWLTIAVGVLAAGAASWLAAGCSTTYRQSAGGDVFWVVEVQKFK